MEAATPLRQPHVRIIGDRVAIDGLVVEDETAVRLVRTREEHGDDPVKTVAYLMERQKLHADRLWDPRTRDKQDKSAA